MEPEEGGFPEEGAPEGGVAPPEKQEEEKIDLGPEVDDDFPTYANDANKELNRKINEKRRVLQAVKMEKEEHEERVKVLQEHFKSVQEEFKQTQDLVDSKNKEIETEDHLKQLEQRQAGKYANDSKKMEAQLADYQDRLNNIQNMIFKANEKIDQFKLEMNWNQEELEQWAIAARQKEEDNLTLEKYRRADYSKIKEMQLQIEKLTLEVTTEIS